MSSLTPLPVARAQPRSAGGIPAVSAVILYDRPASGMRGVEHLRSYVHENHPNAEIEPHVWNFDALRQEGIRAKVHESLAAANIVVIATSSKKWRNAALDRLLDAYLSRKQRIPAALLICDSDETWSVALDIVHEVAAETARDEVPEVHQKVA